MNEIKTAREAVAMIGNVGQAVIAKTGSVAHDYTDPVVYRIMTGKQPESMGKYLHQIK